MASGWVGAQSWTLEGFLGHLSLGGMAFQGALLSLGLSYAIGNVEKIILLLVPAEVSTRFFEIINGRNMKSHCSSRLSMGSNPQPKL